LRALAGFEALNGLLLIGWTASFLFVSMEHFWKDVPASGRHPAVAAEADETAHTIPR
jgi:hypothetical protein